MTISIQLWASALGGDGVAPQDVERVRRELPATPDWHVAVNATHFAFLAPCSPTLAKTAPEICSDEPGFDRMAFHADFNTKVLAFFREHLK